MEQLLVSNAVDQALGKYDFAMLENRSVHIDEKYLDCVDKGYLVASVRDRVMHSGARIAAKADEADVVLELRSGGVGTDNLESFIGTPRLSVPGLLPLELPEVKFWNRKSQMGTAKIGILAYEKQSGSLVAEGGQSLARSDDNRWFLMGIGPFQGGSVRSELETGTSRGTALSRITQPVYVGRRPEAEPPQIAPQPTTTSQFTPPAQPLRYGPDTNGQPHPYPTPPAGPQPNGTQPASYYPSMY